MYEVSQKGPFREEIVKPDNCENVLRRLKVKKETLVESFMFESFCNMPILLPVRLTQQREHCEGSLDIHFAILI